MVWLIVALALLAAAFVFVVWKQRTTREVTVMVPADLARRIDIATAAFAAAEPWHPAKTHAAPASAAAIETALIAGDARKALSIAEGALAAAPDDAACRIWLAWALVANAQPTAAIDQLHHARTRGATDGAFAGYVAARAEHLAFEHAAGATGATPPLVTTADLAVVTLGGGRGGAAWLTGAQEVQLSAAQVRAAVAEHRDVTARCLVRALTALDLAPGFVDAAYLVARLAIKAGLLPQGRALFDAIRPRMVGRPDASAYDRDRTDLDDPKSAVAAAKTPPPSPTAKRSRSLRVL